MTKFEINGIHKQEEAYIESYANRAFAYSCKTCAERGLDTHRHGCENCPIKEAHIKALEEIKIGKRKAPKKFNYGARKYICNNRVTIVMNFYESKE